MHTLMTEFASEVSLSSASSSRSPACGTKDQGSRGHASGGEILEKRLFLPWFCPYSLPPEHVCRALYVILSYTACLQFSGPLCLQWHASLLWDNWCNLALEAHWGVGTLDTLLLRA